MDDVALGLQRLQRLLASRRVFASLANVAGIDLSQQAAQVLRVVAADGPHSVVQVARAAGMDVGAVSRQLSALEDGGLVRRTPAAAHGRVAVSTTPRGRAVARRVERVRARHLAEALAGWSSDERDELGRLLLRLVDDLQTTPYRAAATARTRS